VRAFTIVVRKPRRVTNRVADMDFAARDGDRR
jgi:hypothetical protein